MENDLITLKSNKIWHKSFTKDSQTVSFCGRLPKSLEKYMAFLFLSIEFSRDLLYNIDDILFVQYMSLRERGDKSYLLQTRR